MVQRCSHFPTFVHTATHTTALLRAIDFGSYPATAEILLIEIVMSTFSLVKFIP